MSNVVTLYADKRWKAVSEYESDEGPEVAEYFFEEISDLHMIVEHGRDSEFVIRCTITLNRSDNVQEQNSVRKHIATSVPLAPATRSRELSGPRQSRVMVRLPSELGRWIRAAPN